MSIELPEAYVLAQQMGRELPGKMVGSYDLQDYVRLQKIGMMNRDAGDYGGLVGGSIVSVAVRGNTHRVRLDNRTNLVIALEYGGVVLYHKDAGASRDQYHLRLDFTDGTCLTVRLTSMGCIHAVPDAGLEQNYVFRRDFLGGLDPIQDKQFTPERFSSLLQGQNRMLKSVLLGKDAIVVGISNAAFQEIAYQAKVHPKRRASDLSEDERKALYNAVLGILKERIGQGGKEDFVDLYGRRGCYKPVMSSAMLGSPCSMCGTPIARLVIGGGPSYYCPTCQK